MSRVPACPAAKAALNVAIVLSVIDAWLVGIWIRDHAVHAEITVVRAILTHSVPPAHQEDIFIRGDSAYSAVPSAKPA